MKKKLVIAENGDFSPEVKDYLADYFDVSFIEVSQNSLALVLQQCDVFWFRLGFQIDKSCLSPETRCRIIATPVTGIDHIDEKACAKLGVKIVCLRGEREFLKEVRATAELTIALTLSLLRHIPDAYNDVLMGNWRRDLFRGREIYKKTVGVIGLGRLGRIVSEYFHVLGAEVLGYDITNEELPACVTQMNSIEELIDKSDIVTLHVAYNKNTHHLINQSAIQRFDETKWLINTSRGGIVEEAALLEQLKSNKLAGAALDVVHDEHSFSVKNPLLTYAKENNNLIIVPHIGGNTYESFEKTEKFIAEKVVRESMTWV